MIDITFLNIANFLISLSNRFRILKFYIEFEIVRIYDFLAESNLTKVTIIYSIVIKIDY